MEALVDTKQSLEGLLKPFNSTQRQYVILLLAGFSKQEAVFALSRRPKTMDGYLVDPNFQGVAEFVSENKKKYRDEAFELWEKQLGSKATLFMEAMIEKGLDEINNEKRNNVLLKIAMQAAGQVHAKASKAKGGKPFNYDRMILDRVRTINEPANTG